jgi:poly(A) polymerase
MADSKDVMALVRAMRQALRFSNEEADELAETLEGIRILLHSSDPTIAAKKRFLARSTAQSSRRLMDALAGSGFFTDRIRSLQRELDPLRQTDYAPITLLTGDDLVAAGWMPGPVFKQVLDQVYDAQLEDRIATKEQALELAMRLRTTGAADVARTKDRHHPSSGVPGEEKST